MKLTHDGQFMVTCSQDYCKFWAISDIPTFSPDRIGTILNEQDSVATEDKSHTQKRKRKRKRELVKNDTGMTSDNFFSDL